MTIKKYTDSIINKRMQNEIIDLTDTGGNNSMPVVRELETNPVTGNVTIRSITDQGGDNSRDSAFNDTPIHFVEEDRGGGLPVPEGPELQDPDGDFEEKLEAEGAFIIDSTTHFPASNTKLTKRSQTPSERAEQRRYAYYDK